ECRAGGAPPWGAGGQVPRKGARAARGGPPLEVGEIIRRYGDAILRSRGSRLTPRQRLVLAALAGCRTARMGGHLHRCNACGVETPLYNSCGDRHCPKCQGSERAAWLEERAVELLPVEYFHVVFSVPPQLT